MNLTGEYHLVAMIPTKNRPADLQRTLLTLFRQVRLPQELIVVDQSSDGRSEAAAQEAFAQEPRARAAVRLRYCRTPEINGVPAARNYAIALAEASADGCRPGVWLFLDDDVDLEPDFCHEILTAFREHPHAAGVSGVITNYPPVSWRQRAWETVFRRGPFHDERQPVYRRAHAGRAQAAKRVRYFGGGLMAFRAGVLRGFRNPDARPGCPRDEDVYFCTNVARRLQPDQYFLLTPAARLVHARSPVACAREDWLRAEIAGMRNLYRTHWRRGLWSRACYAWLRAGYALLQIRALRQAPARLAQVEGQP